MPSTGQDNLRSMQRQGDDLRTTFQAPTPINGYFGPSLGVLVTGLAVVGLGLIAWNYIAPDLRRYMKMNSM